MKKILFFIVIIAIIIYNFPKQHKVLNKKFIGVKNCSIMQDLCSVNISATASVSLDITPRGMPPTKSAIVTVKLKNIDAYSINLEFEGIDLDYHPPIIQLNNIDNKTYSGEVYLSLCTLEKTNWIAHLRVYTKTEVWKISYPFVHSGDGYDI